MISAYGELRLFSHLYFQHRRSTVVFMLFYPFYVFVLMKSVAAKKPTKSSHEGPQEIYHYRSYTPLTFH